jgi:GT2 family glycosyltransferase
VQGDRSHRSRQARRLPVPGAKVRVSFTETRPAGRHNLAVAGPAGRHPLSSNRTALSPNESYPQHIVTAVVVAHDGASWLPQLADALLAQTRPVQRVVAVDTGSRDRSGAVLAAKFGQQAVFGMDRATGYGAAIARALQHRAANTQVPRPAWAGAGGMSGAGSQGGMAGGQSGERIEWLWLLHDDCEPAPDALEQLLRGTVETSTAAVLGPKLKDWSNRDIILEAGLTLDTATRRLTGIEPREVDQGQHDGDRDALAVSSAGMLVRRDVWERVGGFDRAMGLFMDDIDFCWRVHAAGFRVRVITDAVLYHAQAATKHKRAISLGRRARMLDRRNGLLTLLGNLPFRQMMSAAAGNVMVSLLRITFFLLAKRLAAAVDEMAALTAVLCHPIRLIKMRGARSRGRRAAYSRVRADVPSGRSARRLAEFAMSALSKSQPDTAGAHHATDDPTDDDSMLIDNGLGRRLLTSPSLLTFVLLLGIAIAAGRSLLASGPLGGGSLVPAWGGASDLWASYLQSFHPAGIGSTTPAPAWLAVIAALSTVLAGKAWLAIDVLLIGCVPLAGMTAMLAVRKVTRSAPVRVWASVTYGLLPVATGVIASGRFGTAVAFVLLPLIVAQAGKMVTESGAPAGRAAWAAGLLVAIAAAFVPLAWVIMLIACVLAAIVFRTTRRGMLRNLAIAALIPPVLLLPWTLTLLSHPAELFLEAGLPQQGTPIFGLPARSLMLLSPGGPGMPPDWVTGGLIAVAFAALFAGRRRLAIIAGWGLALVGLLAAVIVSHLVVQPAEGGLIAIWSGLPLALAAIGLLLAAAAGADALGRLLAGAKGWRAVFSGRGPWVALLGLIACSSPVLAAAAWLGSGVTGPVHPVSNPVVPELVAVAAGQARQVRTLVLRSEHGHVSYLLLRGPSPSLADSSLTPPADAQRVLSRTVSALTTPDGGLAANQAQLLADFDIGFILVQSPVDRQLATVLNNVSGLRTYSSTSGYSLWQLDTTPARVSIVKPDGTVVPIPSGTVGVSGVPVPAGGGKLVLAEPAGGWIASVNGQALAEVPSPSGSWAQAFRLPAGGGTLSVGHPGLIHDLLLLFELLAFLVVASLALPGLKIAELEAQVAATASAAESRSAGRAAGRRAAGQTAARARVGPAAAGFGGADEEPEDAAALVPAPRGAGEAAEAQAGSQGIGRGTRARASRARTAAASRASRNRGGRAAGAGTEAAAAAAAAAGVTAAAGTRRGAGRRRGGTGSRDTASARDDRRASAGGTAGNDRLAEAWPYAPPDESRAGARSGSPAEAWPYAQADEDPASARAGAHSLDSWQYAADEQGTEAGRRSGDRLQADQDDAASRRASSSDPLTGDWYSDERDLARARHGDYSATGLSGWPGDAAVSDQAAGRRGSAAGRSPSGRTPAGDWTPPGPDAAGRSLSGRSAASSWPSTEDDDLAGDGGRPGRRQAGGSPSGSWHDPDAGYQGRGELDRADSGSFSSDRYRQDPLEQAGERSGRDRAGRSGSTRSYKINEPGSPQGRRSHADQDSGRDAGAHRSSSPPVAADWGNDPGASRRGTRRRGRRGGDATDARPYRPERDEWPSDEQPAAWPGGADELEPLPPIEDHGRRRPWQSADDSDWGRLGEAESRDPRWAAPLPDFEPEYDGDSW